MSGIRQTGFPPESSRMAELRQQSIEPTSKELPFAPRTSSVSPSRSARADLKGKRKADDDAPPESFMKRLAGPSTGKAGLTRDPAEVRQIIYEASKGSKFFLNEQKKDAETTAKIDEMLARLGRELAARNGNVRAEEKELDGLAERLEHTRRTDQTVVCVDCDAFYASVEELDNPSLVGVAFGVGSGVLTTASYEARKYGVRSAMAGFVAKKLCPHLVFVKPQFDKYVGASKRIMDILRRYDPNLAPMSLDEAFLNITAYLEEHGRIADDVVAEMRAAVKAETGLTVSAGIGPIKLVAKIAADKNKPDGQCSVPSDRESVMAFMRDLPIRKVYGVGRVTERWLEALDVKTVNDIWLLRGKLALAFGRDAANIPQLLSAYLGVGSADVEPGRREDRKSVGHDTTFSDIWTPEDLDNKLREVADSLGEDMARLEFSGRTITLKLKLSTYEVYTRAKTLGNNVYLSTADDLYKVGRGLLDTVILERKKVGKDLRIRLMGLRFSNLRDESKAKRSKSSIDSWAKPVDKPSKGKSVKTEEPTVIDLLDDEEDRPDWQDLVDELEDKPKVDPDPKVDADRLSGNDARCPICSRTWPNGIKVEQLESHVEICLSMPSSADVKPVKKKVKTAKPVKPANAFDALRKGARRAAQT